MRSWREILGLMRCSWPWASPESMGARYTFFSTDPTMVFITFMNIRMRISWPVTIPGRVRIFIFPAVRRPVATTVAGITGVWPGAVSNPASIIILRRNGGSISQIFVTPWCSVFMPGMTGIGRLSITGRQPDPAWPIAVAGNSFSRIRTLRCKTWLPIAPIKTFLTASLPR